MNRLVICLNCIFVSLVISCHDQSKISQTYTDPQFHFRVTNPDSGWTMTDSTGLEEVPVLFRSESSCGDFHPNISVAIEHLDKMMTPKEYSVLSDSILNSRGFRVLALEDQTINGMAFSVISTVKPDITPALQFWHYCIIRDRFAFIITCTAPVNCFEAYKPFFESVVQSFRFV